LVEVSAAGLPSAAEERSAFIDALTTSGKPEGDWPRLADEQLVAISHDVEQHQAGSTQKLGCWAAGCALRIVYTDAVSKVEPETFATVGAGWAHGMIITAPFPENADMHVSYVFLLSPRN